MLVRYFFYVLFFASMAMSASAGQQALVVDFAQSRIEVAVKATMDSFVGQLSAYEPAILVGDDGGVVSARVAFNFRDLGTGKAKRDKAMHKWQQTDTFPDGRFILQSIDPADGSSTMASGQLTLHGNTRDIRFPVTLRRNGPLYVFDGDVPVDTREFGLPGIRMFGVLKVDPVVHVRFHLQGAPKNSGVAQP